MDKPIGVGSITFNPEPTRVLSVPSPSQPEPENPKEEVVPEDGTIHDLAFLSSLRLN